MSSNHLFLLFALGVLVVYAWLILPFNRIFAFAGAGCIVAAISLAVRRPLQPVGLALLALSVLLFVFEFAWQMKFVPGMAGALLLPVAFTYLFRTPQRIATPLAIVLGLLLGLTSAAMCHIAKRARLNKASDL